MKLATKSRKKRILIILSAVLVIVAGIFGYMCVAKVGVFTPSHQPGTVDLQPATKAQQQAGDAIKEQNADAAKNNASSGASSSPTSGTQSSSSVTVTVTAASYQSSILYVRAEIEKVTNSGTCNLTLTRTSDNKAYTASAAVSALASTSTCQGFNIPGSVLGSGQWKATVAYANGKENGSGTWAQEITIP